MRKALILLVVFAVVGAAAFADAPVAAWSVTGLYGFGIYTTTAASIVPYDYSQVGTNRTRLDFDYTSADKNAGFVMETQLLGITTANTSVGAGSTVWSRWNVWGKMFDGMLTIKGGQGDDYSVATKDWNAFGTTDGGSFAYVAPGISFILTPISGLNILFHQVLVQASANIDGDEIGASYTMPGIGGVQLGILPTSIQTTADGNRVYFGFNVTAVENLTAILEGRVFLGKDQSPIQLNELVSYAMGPMTVGARIGEYNNKTGFDWGFEPTLAFKLDDKVTLNAIVNIYTYNAGSVSNVTFMSPIDCGTVGAGDPNKVNFGGGVSANYAISGFTLTVGDYFGAGNKSGNIIYVNADVTL